MKLFKLISKINPYYGKSYDHKEYFYVLLNDNIENLITIINSEFNIDLKQDNNSYTYEKHYRFDECANVFSLIEINIKII